MPTRCGCGYHIIIELEKEVMISFVNKEVLPSSLALSNCWVAIAGDHVRRLRAVTITQSHGRLIYKDLRAMTPTSG